jgi:hypothetical protein
MKDAQLATTTLRRPPPRSSPIRDPDGPATAHLSSSSVIDLRPKPDCRRRKQALNYAPGAASTASGTRQVGR